MKIDRLKHAIMAVAGLALIGCSSAGTPAPEPVVPTVAAPLPGENFVVFYTDGTGLRKRDTRIGSDIVILPRSPTVSNGETTFGAELTAFSQRSNDSTWLRIFVDESDAPATDWLVVDVIA